MKNLLSALLLTVTIGVSSPVDAGHKQITSISSDKKPKKKKTYKGIASWYGVPHHGRRTASGEIFNMNALTAAHKTIPLGTRVRVTNELNGRSVEVLVNDRGPFAKGRIIDLSKEAAKRLDILKKGHGEVVIDVI